MFEDIGDGITDSKGLEIEEHLENKKYEEAE